MKLLIAGGRDFNDFPLFSEKLDKFIQLYGFPAEIVSGKCPTGADALGEEAAGVMNIPVAEFPANWQTYGKAAGPIRNTLMAYYCTHSLLFWDRKSRGTNDMRLKLKAAGKPYRVVYY